MEKSLFSLRCDVVMSCYLFCVLISLSMDALFFARFTPPFVIQK